MSQANQAASDRIVPLFKCKTLGSIILADGTLVAFVNKQYYTQDKFLIAQLQACADRGEFGVYIDPKDPNIDLDAATPMERLRKQIREELLAEQRSGKVHTAEATEAPKVSPTAGLATTVNASPVQANPQMTALQALLEAKKGNNGAGSNNETNENADNSQP